MIILKQHTKVNRANNNSKSLKATIPKAICDVLEIEHSDEVTWTINVIEGQKVVTIKKREVEE